jgi:hypothetical protein
MDLPPAIAALARLLRADIRQLIEATNQQTCAAHDAAEAAKQKAEAPQDVVVSTSADKKFVVEVHPQDPQGQTTQTSIKRATWFAGWGAWFAVLGAGIYAAIAGYTLSEMRTQTRQIAKQFEAEQRPWVSVDNFTVESPLKFDSNGSATITFGFQIKNTGRSPAIRGFWQPDLFLQWGEVPSPVKRRDDMCNFAGTRSTKVTDQRLTETWFPGDPLPKQIQMGFGPDDIANSLKIPQQFFPNVPHQKEFDSLSPDFIVCVAYRDSFTDTQYHTGYILQLRRITSGNPYIFPVKSGEIPARDLKLYIHPFYGIDAK